MNRKMIISQKLTAESQLERLHKNVDNIIMHLLNLDLFLTKIRTLIKEIMFTIADDWNIKSPVPQATLKKREKTQE